MRQPPAPATAPSPVDTSAGPGGDEDGADDGPQRQEARTDREGHREPVDDAGLGGPRAVGHDVARRRGRSQGIEQCRAERTTDLLRRVDQRAGHAGVAVADPDQGGAAEGGEGQPQADAHQDLLRCDVQPEVALHPDLGQPGQPAGGNGEADRHRDPRPDTWDEAGRGARGQDDAEGEGQEGEPRLQRRVVQHALQVVAQEDEHGEEPGAREQGGEEGAAPVPVPHHAQREQRVARLRLDHDERDQ